MYVTPLGFELKIKEDGSNWEYPIYKYIELKVSDDKGVKVDAPDFWVSKVLFVGEDVIVLGQRFD